MDRAEVPVNSPALRTPRRIRETEAAGCNSFVKDVYQADPDGVPGTPISAGEVFFIYQYALSLIRLADTPGEVPPNYALFG